MSVITHPHARELTKSVRATVLVFNDPRSRELLERIERLAPSEANALVIGETGTGKELVARHIHALSGRNGGPFVAVNCGAFAESLVESELFGHEKGAFTGALQSKAGWFEAANGGTLFLDEIGDLPPSIQVKLLRVLQEREVVRLGSRRPIPIDVRLVAATNVDLADAVVAGHFREDLFYRLHVATIQLPPLRERRGDILPLAEYFIVEHCRRLGYTSASLSPEAERKLLGHSWAGNIRELENAIHHALLVCRNRLIQPADLHLIDMRARQEPNGLRRAPEAPPARRWRRRCRRCSRKTARISTSTSRKPCSVPPIASATATSCRPDACWGSAATSCAPAWRRSASWKPRHGTTWSRWWASERGASQSFTIPPQNRQEPGRRLFYNGAVNLVGRTRDVAMPRSARLCRSLPVAAFPAAPSPPGPPVTATLVSRPGEEDRCMPYCSPEQLADLGPLLDCLRRWPRIREPRPGVFYLGDQPFCQFHSRNGQRWADVKRRKGRLPPFVLPPGDQHSARAFQIFLLQAYKLN